MRALFRIRNVKDASTTRLKGRAQILVDRLRMIRERPRSPTGQAMEPSIENELVEIVAELERRGEWPGSEALGIDEALSERPPSASSSEDGSERFLVMQFKDPGIKADAIEHAEDPSVRSLIDEHSERAEKFSPLCFELFSLAGELAEQWTGLLESSGSPLIGDYAILHVVAGAVPPLCLHRANVVDDDELNDLVHAQAYSCMGTLLSPSRTEIGRDGFYEALDTAAERYVEMARLLAPHVSQALDDYAAGRYDGYTIVGRFFPIEMGRIRDLVPVGLPDDRIDTPFIGVFTASVTAGVELFERLSDGQG